MGGHLYFFKNGKSPHNNVAILNVTKIMKAIMSSAAEAELGRLFMNARKAIEVQNILTKMGHPQTPTPMQ